VEAARALRNGVETGVLRVTHNGARDDLVSHLSGVYTGEKTLYVVALASGGDLKRWENF
jgi:hypothetical protein